MFEEISSDWAKAYRKLGDIVAVQGDHHAMIEALTSASMMVACASSPKNRALAIVVMTYLDQAKDSFNREWREKAGSAWNYFIGVACIAHAQSIVYEILFNETKDQ